MSTDKLTTIVAVGNMFLKLTDLPTEILFNIIGWCDGPSLIALRSVCKIWKNAVDSAIKNAKDISATQWTPFFDETQNPCPGKIVLINESRCEDVWTSYQQVMKEIEPFDRMAVTGFAVRNWNEHGYPIAKQLIQAFGKHLQVLTIHQDDSAHIYELLQLTPNLTTLSLENGQSALDTIFEQSNLPEMPRLKTLVFKFCDGETMLALLTKYSQQLKSLSITLNEKTNLNCMLSVLTSDPQAFSNIENLKLCGLKSFESINQLVQITSTMTEFNINRLTLKLDDLVTRNVSKTQQLLLLQQLVPNLSKTLEKLHLDTQLALTIAGCTNSGIWRAFSTKPWSKIKVLHLHAAFLLYHQTNFLNNLKMVMPNIKQLGFIRWNEVSREKLNAANVYLSSRIQYVPFNKMLRFTVDQLNKFFEPFWPELKALEEIVVLKDYDPDETVYKRNRYNWNEEKIQEGEDDEDDIMSYYL